MAVSAATPPSGTVAMLFTDIEGSTRLAQQLADDWEALLARHRAILRSAIAAHGGYEVGTEGDSFFVTFASARAAVNAAVDAQRGLASESWPDGARVRVRMGVHVGEVTLEGGDYVGVEVHRAARLAALGRGGQVLLSDAAVAVVGDRLPEGLDVEDAGEYELKDFDRPVRVHVLVGTGLTDGAPASAARHARRGHLPERRAAFIGRRHELAAVTQAVRASRLVTLTGPGGTGKTSLGIEAARELAGDYTDGAWLIELGSLRDPEFVVATIHRVLGAAEDPARAPLESLTRYLADRRALLLLDNGEQLLPAVAGTVDELLRATSHVAILATSREPLHLAGEQQVPVPPLTLPPSGASAACPSPSSWLRRASRCWSRPRSSSVSPRARAGSPPPPRSCPSDSERCARRSAGAIGSWANPNRPSSRGWRCSPEASPSTRPMPWRTRMRSSAARRSSSSGRSSTRAS